MLHDVLGVIDRGETDSRDGVATIRYESREIKIQIIPDDQPFERSVELAAEVVARLAELDKTAKRAIVADLRDVYNDSWREYERVEEDGSRKLVSNPELSKNEFEAKFSLNGIDVIGSDIVDFFYDDCGLFSGHHVVVNSLNGTDFSDARAEFFG